MFKIYLSVSSLGLSPLWGGQILTLVFRNLLLSQTYFLEEDVGINECKKAEVGIGIL
jgi:hypothetical protein